MSERPPAPPPLLLEKAALGECTEAELERVDALLAERGQSRAEVEDELSASNEAILRAYPPEAFARAVRERAATRSRTARRGRRPLGAVAALAAALAALALLGPWWSNEPLPQRADDSALEVGRVKGISPGLRIWKRTPGGAPIALERDSLVRVGDEIQLGVAPPVGARHAVVVSIDGRGLVTLHVPGRPSESSTIPLDERGAKIIALPFAYELDDAPGHETFYLIASDEPIDPELVLRAARGAAREVPARLPLPRDAFQDQFALRKGPQ